LDIEITGASGLRGEYTPPPDKSISHRAVMFSALATGRSVVRNMLRSGDTLSTIGAFRALGATIEDTGGDVLIESPGWRGLREPLGVIDCGNSGTTMRLLVGLLSGLPLFTVLVGDESLTRRPMRRVIDPMRLMGARIMARDGDRYPPVALRGGALGPIAYEMPVPSAQVKTAVLLAALTVGDESIVTERMRSRDHTERLLPAFGADLRVEGLTVRVRGGSELRPAEVDVPGDFSSAAFFMAAAMITPGSELLVKSVGMNPTRTGLLEILFRMGADVEVLGERTVAGEPVADILCRSSRLKGVTVEEGEIPAFIDEFPIFCVLAALAEGRSEVRGAGELRVKESDRIAAMAVGLRAMGAAVEEYDDGLAIDGGGGLRGAPVESAGDHRIAMSLAVAGLAAEGTTLVRGAEAVHISYPSFFDTLAALRGG
jgi:3-phosphoshikimate 1-carboxyvinyltransferase